MIFFFPLGKALHSVHAVGFEGNLELILFFLLVEEAGFELLPEQLCVLEGAHLALTVQFGDQRKLIPASHSRHVRSKEIRKDGDDVVGALGPQVRAHMAVLEGLEGELERALLYALT